MSSTPSPGDDVPQVPLEDFVPFEQSVLWRVHDAYYAALGAGAFVADVPSRATSNPAFARQHLRYLEALVAQAEQRGQLAPGAPLRVLELGAGAGEFAATFLDEAELNAPELADRLTYVVSDYSRRSVEDALGFEELAAHVEAGRAMGASCDLRAPTDVRALSGELLRGPWLLVVANYLCCVARAQAFQRRDGQLFERWVRVSAPASRAGTGRLEPVLAAVGEPGLMASLRVEEDWRPAVRLGEPAQALHAAVLREVLEPLPVASLVYPTTFIAALDALRTELHPAGAMLVADYGATAREELAGAQLARPQHYGNTLNYPVNFSLFEALGAVRGLAVLRTSDELRAVKVAALHPDTAGASAASFAHAFEGERAGEALVDLHEAAGLLAKAGSHPTSARLLARCRELDARSPYPAVELIEACLDAERFAAALAACDDASDVVADAVLDALRGRALLGLGRNADAVTALERSLAEEPDAAVAANLALAQDRLGAPSKAVAAARLAFDLDPQDARVAALLTELEATELRAGEHAPAPGPPPPPPPTATDVIEDFVPFDRSVLYALGDAYVEARGRQAYVDAVPCQAAASRLLTEAHVRFWLAALDAAPASDEPLLVLDLGGGTGDLAARVLELTRALAPAHFARLRYVLADVQPRVVEEALAQPALARFAAEGRLIGARLELGAGLTVRTLGGAPLAGPWSLVLASYVCGAWPAKGLWLRAAGSSERWVRTRLPGDDAVRSRAALLGAAARPGLAAALELDDAWRPLPAGGLSDAHERALARWLAREGPGPVPYPVAFVDALLTLVPQLAAEGVVLVVDGALGSASSPRLGRLPLHRVYGNTCVFPVAFELLSDVAGAQGWGVHRTHDELRELHVAALTRAPRPRLAATFTALYEEDPRAEAYEDLWDAGRALMVGDQPLPAARVFKRALALDATDPALWAVAIQAALAAGYFTQALAWIDAASQLDAPPPALQLWRERALLARQASSGAAVGEPGHEPT